MEKNRRNFRNGGDVTPDTSNRWIVFEVRGQIQGDGERKCKKSFIVFMFLIDLQAKWSSVRRLHVTKCRNVRLLFKLFVCHKRFIFSKSESMWKVGGYIIPDMGNC